MRSCTIEGCNNRHYGLGLCDKHWTRFRRHGDPSVVKTAPGPKRGRGNHRWKDHKTYVAMHQWLRNTYGPARNHGCDFCFSRADDWAYTHHCLKELTGVSGGRSVRYSLDPTLYIPLCKPCHNKLDHPPT